MKANRRQFLAAAAASAGAAAPNPAIVKAMESVRAAIPRAESDPARPVYHFRPPANWNNDPNGTIFYRGWHHLFYQHNPYGAEWGNMHWGHARSRDLVNWEHLPIALWPSKEKGEEHVFSGGAIEGPGGRPLLFYTSIGMKGRPPEQWLALPRDDDLITWEKYAGNPVVSLKHHGSYTVEDWRDPYLFYRQGKTYMVCGGNFRFGGGRATVQLYEATNRELTGWKHMGPVFEYRSREVVNIECPNLFPLGTKWVLLISPHRPCEYFVGEMNWERMKFEPETHGVLDAGSAYASNISYDEQDRCILWLWGRTATDPRKGWNSVMTLPRILSIGDDGYLRQQPAPEFESLRGGLRQAAAPQEIANRAVPLGEKFAGDCLELRVELEAGTAASLGLRVRCAEGGKAGLEISFNPRSGALAAGAVKTVLARQKRLSLRVFLDKRAVEVYANGGSVAIFTTTDAGPEDLGVEVFAAGGTAKLLELAAWPLKPARFSMEHYRE